MSKKRQQQMRRAVDSIVDNAVNQAIREQDTTTAKGFFSNMMSVDEARVSVLMISLLLSLLFGGWAYISYGEISQTWASLVETFAYCVTGINMLAALTPSGSKATQLIAKALTVEEDRDGDGVPDRLQQAQVMDAAPVTQTIQATQATQTTKSSKTTLSKK